ATDGESALGEVADRRRCPSGRIVDGATERADGRLSAVEIADEPADVRLQGDRDGTPGGHRGDGPSVRAVDRGCSGVGTHPEDPPLRWFLFAWRAPLLLCGVDRLATWAR